MKLSRKILIDINNQITTDFNMIDISKYLISFVQIICDLLCLSISLLLIYKAKKHRTFYTLNFFSFIALLTSDLYYNYFYRILNADILSSARLIETLPLLSFQLMQSFNWYIFLKNDTKIISWLNLPYLLFAAIVTLIFGYFFYITNSLSVVSTFEDVSTVALDMSIWVLTIISLARTKNRAIAMLALGCLMIVSADLTFTCLFMFDMKNVSVTHWPHCVWAFGAMMMTLGLIKSKTDSDFTFYDPNSIHAKSNWWLLISSLIAFLIGLTLPFFFIESENVYTIRYALWDVPISLMFTMIASTLISNRFSEVILSPIKSFSQSIESFNLGSQSEITISSEINEFKILCHYINKSFLNVSKKLDHEVNISAQVAHDVRSPLGALEIGLKSLPSTFDESKRILLRDAVQHIRDITNNLDKAETYSNAYIKYPTQISVLIDNVVSQKRISLLSNQIKLEQFYGPNTYEYFSEIVPSMLKRIITNILNNACEAIDQYPGVITVSIKKLNSMCIISIEDNGCGITNLNRKSMFVRGFSTKKEGSGLGLYHANEKLIEWGGYIKINSVVKVGTNVELYIPLVSPSLWFTSKLSLLNNEIVVCVDDCLSVYHAWLERFKFLNINVTLIHCPSKITFLSEFSLLKYKSATYLIDYEFTGKDYNGIDFANFILMLENKNNRIYIVTSRSADDKIQDYCIKNNVHIIPKNFSSKIPIEIFDLSKKLIVLIPIDTQDYIALDSNDWHIYTNANDLIADLPYFRTFHQLYIHHNSDDVVLKNMLQIHNITAIYFDKISNLELSFIH